MKPKITIVAVIVAAVACILLLADADDVSSVNREPIFLSVFMPHAGGCGWYRTRLPGGEDEAITRFHVDCSELTMTWSPDFKRAVVWSGGDMDLMAWLVDVAEKESKRLPPFEGDGRKFFFTPEGSVAALVVRQTDADNFVSETLQLREGNWHKTKALAEAPVRPNPLATDGEWREVTDNLLYSQLDPLMRPAMQRPERKWRRRAMPAYPYALLAFASDEEIPDRTPAILRWEKQGEVLPLPDFDFSHLDLVTLASRDKYLLIVDAVGHMSPQVYSWQTGNLVYSFKAAHLVEFWPEAQN